MDQITNGGIATAAFYPFLARLLRHSELSRTDQEAILSLSGQAAQWKAGADFVRPDTSSGHSHLVVHGVVARFDQGRDSRKAATALFVTGDICDLQAIETSAGTVGLCALTSCTVFRIPHGQLRRLVESHPAIRRALWKEMAIAASIQAKLSGNLVLRSGVSRAAHLLCELGLRTERAGLGIRTSFAIKTTQDLLAQAVGLTPVHTNRVLRQLREMHLISNNPRTIVVKDWHGLCELAEFNPAYLLLER